MYIFAYTYSVDGAKSKNTHFINGGVSFRPINPNHLPAPKDPLESRGGVARTRRYDRSSSPAAAGRASRIMRYRYYRYYPYYMYYEYHTDVRATSVEQARHDGSFFLRFPLRASHPPRLSSRRVLPRTSSSRLILLFDHPPLYHDSSYSRVHLSLSLSYSAASSVISFYPKAESERAV